MFWAVLVATVNQLGEKTSSIVLNEYNLWFLIVNQINIRHVYFILEHRIRLPVACKMLGSFFEKYYYKHVLCIQNNITSHVFNRCSAKI